MTQNEAVAVGLADEKLARRCGPEDIVVVNDVPVPAIPFYVVRAAMSWSRVKPDVFGDLTGQSFGRLDCGALVR